MLAPKSEMLHVSLTQALAELILINEIKCLTAEDASEAEAEAEACDVHWIPLAEAQHIDHRKVNAEIELSIQARRELNYSHHGRSAGRAC